METVTWKECNFQGNGKSATITCLLKVRPEKTGTQGNAMGLTNTKPKQELCPAEIKLHDGEVHGEYMISYASNSAADQREVTPWKWEDPM